MQAILSQFPLMNTPAEQEKCKNRTQHNPTQGKWYGLVLNFTVTFYADVNVVQEKKNPLIAYFLEKEILSFAAEYSWKPLLLASGHQYGHKRHSHQHLS